MKTFFAVLFLMLVFLPFSRAVSEERSVQSLLRELHEAPSIPYFSDDEKKEAQDAFEAADSVFVGVIEDVQVRRAGPGPGIPLVHIRFSGVDVFYGDPAQDGTYTYRKSPDTVTRLGSRKAIVLLEREGGSGKASYFVKQLLPADKYRLGWLIEFLGGDVSQEDCAEVVETACEETVL